MSDPRKQPKRESFECSRCYKKIPATQRRATISGAKVCWPCMNHLRRRLGDE